MQSQGIPGSFPFGLDPKLVVKHLRDLADEIEAETAVPQRAEISNRFVGDDFSVEVLHVEFVTKVRG